MGRTQFIEGSQERKIILTVEAAARFMKEYAENEKDLKEMKQKFMAPFRSPKQLITYTKTLQRINDVLLDGRKPIFPIFGPLD